MYLDCRRKAAEELIALLGEAAELLEASLEKVRVLANVEETFLTSEFMSRMRTLGKEVFSRKEESPMPGGLGNHSSSRL